MRFLAALAAATTSSSAWGGTVLDWLAEHPGRSLETLSELYQWEEPTPPEHIVGPIWAVGTRGLGAWLIKTSAGCILLNTGTRGSGKMIAEAIGAATADEPCVVKWLLAGHAHIDHVGGHAEIVTILESQYPAFEVVMLDDEAELLSEGVEKDFQYSAEEQFAFTSVRVDRRLNDGQPFPAGDIVLTPHHTPGHTKGTTTWTTVVEEHGVKYNVVFVDGANVNPGYRLAREPLSYADIEHDFRDTYKKLDDLPVDIWLSAHLEDFDFACRRLRAAQDGVRAWLNADAYRAWLAHQRQKFEKTVAEQRAGRSGNAVLFDVAERLAAWPRNRACNLLVERQLASQSER